MKHANSSNLSGHLLRNFSVRFTKQDELTRDAILFLLQLLISVHETERWREAKARATFADSSWIFRDKIFPYANMTFCRCCFSCDETSIALHPTAKYACLITYFFSTVLSPWKQTTGPQLQSRLWQNHLHLPLRTEHLQKPSFLVTGNDLNL